MNQKIVMEVKPILRGVATFVPGLYKLVSRQRTGGTDNAEYCYDVWLKHICMSWRSGLRNIPETVAELGPGDSLGVGLAALLSGVERYYAFDVVRYANLARNVEILENLIELFRQRRSVVPIGWPDFSDCFDSSGFPSSIFSEDAIERALREERVDSIRESLRTGEGLVSYQVPWDRMTPALQVDYILSHSVMEHVNDIDAVYRACASWLKTGGVMSHQIDFRSHGITKKWGGHWDYPDWAWRLVYGRRPFLINRAPFSEHVGLIAKNGFKIVAALRNQREAGVARTELAPRYKHLSDEDLMTCSGFILARK